MPNSMRGSRRLIDALSSCPLPFYANAHSLVKPAPPSQKLNSKLLQNQTRRSQIMLPQASALFAGAAGPSPDGLIKGGGCFWTRSKFTNGTPLRLGRLGVRRKPGASAASTAWRICRTSRKDDGGGRTGGGGDSVRCTCDVHVLSGRICVYSPTSACCVSSRGLTLVILARSLLRSLAPPPPPALISVAINVVISSPSRFKIDELAEL